MLEGLKEIDRYSSCQMSCELSVQGERQRGTVLHVLQYTFQQI